MANMKHFCELGNDLTEKLKEGWDSIFEKYVRLNLIFN